LKLDFVTWDLETSNLNADFSILLSSVIKPYQEAPIVHRIDTLNPLWEVGKRKDDRAIVYAVSEELQKHAVIITHYGTGFDLPYLKAKMVKYDLEPLPPISMVDTFWVAKRNLKVSRRRLEALAEYFFGESKTKVEGNLWTQAFMDGDKAAMDNIVEHNVQDCVLLEMLTERLLPYIKTIGKK
jgi:uncharacterized protein YprB with RNaseH-like and TPR domain